MSKILIVLFLLGSFSSQSQIDISILKGSINSQNSDLDFYQIDDTTAFFTSSYFNGSKQVSEIFISKKSNNLWDRNTYKNLNFENFISGNISFDVKRNHFYFTLCHSFNNCDIYIYNEGKAENLSEKYPDVWFNNWQIPNLDFDQIKLKILQIRSTDFIEEEGKKVLLANNTANAKVTIRYTTSPPPNNLHNLKYFKVILMSVDGGAGQEINLLRNYNMSNLAH